MLNLIHSLTNLALSKRLVCISETNHFSSDSHQFHLTLFKSLYKHDFKVLGTELLTPSDALFMTLWTRGLLKCSLTYLFSDVLFMKGIGTYPILEWAKGKTDLFFIGLERRGSTHFIFREGAKHLIKQLVAPPFYKAFKPGLVEEPS